MKIKCKICKEFFSKEDIVYKLPIGNICSKECLKEFQEQKNRKKKVAAKIRRDNDIPQDTRRKLRSRDRAQCRRCGGKNGIELHHIRYRSGGVDHSESNLISLCPKCHIPIIHSNKKYYQPLLLELIELGNQGRFLSLIQLERLKNND